MSVNYLEQPKKANNSCKGGEKGSGEEKAEDSENQEGRDLLC